MMPQYLSVLVLLIFGGGILAVAWQGHCHGLLPAGSSLWGRHMVSREANFFAFYVLLVMYYAAGMALAVWGLLCLLGMAPPMSWR